MLWCLPISYILYERLYKNYIVYLSIKLHLSISFYFPPCEFEVFIIDRYFNCVVFQSSFIYFWNKCCHKIRLVLASITRSRIIWQVVCVVSRYNFHWFIVVYKFFLVWRNYDILPLGYFWLWVLAHFRFTK